MDGPWLKALRFGGLILFFLLFIAVAYKLNNDNYEEDAQHDAHNFARF
jgi:hypothetical protein